MLESGVISSSSTTAHAFSAPFALPVYTFSHFPSVNTEGSALEASAESIATGLQY